MATIVSISVSPEFDELRKVHSISWSEAARVGMSILLAERGLKDYDNDLNLYRKMRLYQSEAEKALQKLNQVMEKGSVAKVEDDSEKEADEILRRHRVD